jgi:signal peptide peptidase SppA
MRSAAEQTGAGDAAEKYTISNGVALVYIAGFMVKGDSKFSETVSTVRIRQAIRAANADPKANAILLVIDSPGGTTAGTAELARDVATSRKPIHAHIDDLGASAAYWVASQARRVTANATAMVGSIGTVAVLEDTSKAFAMAGISVHVLSTGEFKGQPADGAPIGQNVIGHYQKLVNDLNEHFVSAVSRGRVMSRSDLKPALDGRVFTAESARKLGLIDAVQSLEEALLYAIAAKRNGSR